MAILGILIVSLIALRLPGAVPNPGPGGAVHVAPQQVPAGAPNVKDCLHE